MPNRDTGRSECKCSAEVWRPPAIDAEKIRCGIGGSVYKQLKSCAY